MLYSNFGSLKPDTESHSHLAIYDNFGQFQWTDADGDTAKHYICETGKGPSASSISTENKLESCLQRPHLKIREILESTHRVQIFNEGDWG